MSDGQIRPLEFGELLDQSFSLYRRNFRLLFTISVIPGLLLAPATLFLREPYGVVPKAGDLLRYFMPIFVWAIVYSLVNGAASVATVAAASEIYLGRSITVGQAYRKVGEFWGRILNLWFSVGIRIMAAAMTFFLLPLAILMMLWYAFSLQILLFERVRVSQAIKRSRELTKGNRAKIFVTVLLMSMLVWVMSMIVTMPAIFVQSAILTKGQIPPVWLTLVISVLSTCATAVAHPPMMVALTLLYYNTRVVKEGFDLQFLLDGLGPAEPHAPEQPHD
jgi:hypothetical protein